MRQSQQRRPLPCSLTDQANTNPQYNPAPVLLRHSIKAYQQRTAESIAPSAEHIDLPTRVSMALAVIYIASGDEDLRAQYLPEPICNRVSDDDVRSCVAALQQEWAGAMRLLARSFFLKTLREQERTDDLARLTPI